MNVRELITHLESLAAEFGDDLPVRFTYNCGDHWRTTVAQEPTDIGLCRVVPSDYHDMDRVTDDEDADYTLAVCLS